MIRSEPKSQFICRADAAKRASVAPQLIDYWVKKYPGLMKHYDGGRVFVAIDELDKIIAARKLLKGVRVPR